MLNEGGADPPQTLIAIQNPGKTLACGIFLAHGGRPRNCMEQAHQSKTEGDYLRKCAQCDFLAENATGNTQPVQILQERAFQ